MCCQSEVALIQKKLGSIAGVSNIKINLMLRRVVVHAAISPSWCWLAVCPRP